MSPSTGISHRLRPHRSRPRRLQNLDRFLPEKLHALEVLRMTGRGETHRRQTPRVLHVRIQIHAIALERKLCKKRAYDHLAVGLLPERPLVPQSPTRGVVRPLKPVLYRLLLAPRGHAPAPVEATFGIARHEIQNGRSADDALVLVERMLEQPARAAIVSGHQILAHDAVGIRQAVRKPRRPQAVRRQHHRLGFLKYLASLRVEIDSAGYPPAAADCNFAHVAAGSDLASAGLLRNRQHRHSRTRASPDLASEP